MKIGEMFAKKIDRPIKGVIKVGQSDSENVFQELDEYVVTKELAKHFREFFSNYRRSLTGKTDAMGVWISGFFGNGKSHFLKILSYLLENKNIGGKRAIEYFIDGKKIIDETVLANMRLAGNTPADVILFNIDSKSATSSNANKDAIADVFMRVFNKQQGYCGTIPFLAEFERKLDIEDTYDSFKTEFEKVSKQKWVDVRDEFFHKQDAFVKALANAGIMSEPAARNWCQQGGKEYTLSIDKFAHLVKDYCDRKGNNHRVIFLVDEIGQYIAEDTKLMLNLQTLTEDLGRICEGRAWVIVTSQQDIDSFTKVRSNDFSKIIGRFDTQLPLSGAHVDEVIRKRILQKNAPAISMLQLLYDQKQAIIKNLLTFTTDTAYKQLYEDRTDFAAVYPFLPYQFHLLQEVLTAIRLNGASGKHLAEGERSMIALFKESAERYKDTEEIILIPFNVFFAAIERFLDHTHAIVIAHAEQNKMLEPFDVELLKVLFMIKYVKGIKGYPENLVTLMISSIDEDRIALRKKVDESLTRLLSQTLIQKNGEIYTFLTNEEQDINRSISQESAEMGEIIQEVSATIFEDIYKEKKFRYSTRYNFAFNQIVDGRFYKNTQGYDVGIRVISPYANDSDEAALLMQSSNENNVIVVLPQDTTFLDEITEMIKIRKFLTKQGAHLTHTFATIKAAKETENNEKRKRIRTYIEEALRHADIYVGGTHMPVNAKDPVDRINEAMMKLIITRYHKLALMETAPTLQDIESLFKNMGTMTLIGLDGGQYANQLAMNDVQETITLNSRKHLKTVMKSLMDKYSGAAPYGFVELDVQWLVAALFRQGKITFTLNGQNISMLDSEPADIVRYITRKEYLDKLVIENREVIPEKHIKAVRDVIKDFFQKAITSTTEDGLMADFLRYTDHLKSEAQGLVDVEYKLHPKFPGSANVKKAINLMTEVRKYTRVSDFFRFIFERQDEFIELSEGITPVFSFFEGEQKDIYEKALRCDELYEMSKVYITDTDLISAIGAIKLIINKENPYSEIYKLPPLIERFTELHVNLMEVASEPVRAAVEADYKVVQEAIEGKDYATQFTEDFHRRFASLKTRIDTAHGIAEIMNIQHESDALKVRCIDEIEAAKPEPVVTPQPGNDPPHAPKPPVKKKKTLSIKQMVSSSTSISSDEDIEMFLNTLRVKLKKELEGNDSINIIQ